MKKIIGERVNLALQRARGWGPLYPLIGRESHEKLSFREFIVWKRAWECLNSWLMWGKWYLSIDPRGSYFTLAGSAIFIVQQCRKILRERAKLCCLAHTGQPHPQSCSFLCKSVLWGFFASFVIFLTCNISSLQEYGSKVEKCSLLRWRSNARRRYRRKTGTPSSRAGGGLWPHICFSESWWLR